MKLEERQGLPMGSKVVPFWGYLIPCRILSINHKKEP